MGRMPLARGLGCPPNLFYFKISPRNIGGREARATARVAPTGLHCLRCDRAAYALKQTICGGACASERCGRPANYAAPYLLRSMYLLNIPE